jgi:putative membrane protein
MADGAFGRRRVPASRDEAEALFERLVRENRFTVAVVFPLVGGVLLVASAEGWLPPPLAFNPLLVLAGVLVMRSPLLAAVAPLVDRRAGAGLLALTAYAYVVEYVGVTTGVPYGEFVYGVALGPTLGGVPVGLPVFFIPLVMNAYLLCLLLLGRTADRPSVRVGVVVAAVVAMDLALDPGAVSLGFWRYPGGGAFYGVPLSNFAGWVLSATVGVVVLDRSFDRRALLARLDDAEFALDDLVSFVVLWGGVNVWFGNWAAAGVAATFGVGLLRTDQFDAGLLRPQWPFGR